MILQSYLCNEFYFKAISVPLHIATSSGYIEDAWHSDIHAVFGSRYELDFKA